MAFLQSECHYSLKPGRFRTQQPVAEFLFEKKKGYCEYFASATAVLLRLQGIPARYVRGFTVREANRIGGHYVVREADAHAWVEAFVPGRGWVEADATPAGEYEAAHGGIDRGGLQALWAWVSGRFAELRALFAARAGSALVARLAEVARGLVRGRPGLVTLTVALLAGSVDRPGASGPLVRKLRGRRRARRARPGARRPARARGAPRANRSPVDAARPSPAALPCASRAPRLHPAWCLAAHRCAPDPSAWSRPTTAGRFAGHPVTAAEVRTLNLVLEAAASGKAKR